MVYICFLLFVIVFNRKDASGMGSDLVGPVYSPRLTGVPNAHAAGGGALWELHSLWVLFLWGEETVSKICGVCLAFPESLIIRRATFSSRHHGILAEPMGFRGWGLPEATGSWWAEQNKLPQVRSCGDKHVSQVLKDQPTDQWACCQRVRPALSDPCVKDADGARIHPNTKPFWPKAGVGLV